ncbi:MAG: DUF4279 domain-containing protein [Oscillospiraceae bacterium]|nr:DUF4279 domain-containing protein [Oscillospiraceae bacterium]
MIKTTVRAYIVLVGDDYDVNHVTQELNIMPTWTNDKDEILRHGRKRGYMEWAIDTGDEPSLDNEIQLNKILLPIRNKADIMCNLSELYNANWYIIFVVRIENGDTPSMYLSKENIKFISSINASIDFDVYVLSAREE